MEKLAYKIPEAVQVAPVGKTRLYEAINGGALKAHKQGAHPIIMRDDLEAWLRALPDYEPAHSRNWQEGPHEQSLHPQET